VKDYSQMTDEELDQAILEKSGASQSPQVDFSNLSDEDLDNMLAEQIMTEQDSEPEGRPVEAFAQGFGNAASFGYLPQIQAATEPAIQKIMGLFGDDVDEQIQEQGFVIDEAPEDSYVERRDKFIRKGQKLAEENPYSSAAGGVTGAITSGIATGGGLSSLLGTAGKTATMGKRFVDAAKTGAAIGAVRNPGDTEGAVDVFQVGDRAKNAVKDAATGLVIQGGLEGLKKVGEGVKSAGKNLKTYSQNKSLKASGAMLKDFRKAVGKKKAGELGQTAIDEKLVAMGDDIADTAKKSEAAVKESGKKIGAIYDKADDVTTLSAGDLRSLNDDFLQDASKRLEGTIRGDEVAQKLEGVLGTIRGVKNPTFGQLRKLRSSIDDEINFSKTANELPAYQEELLHLRNKIQDMVKQKIGQANPELSRQLARENKRYSNLSEISKISKDKMAREESNAAFGLRERISGGVGATVGAMIGGPVGAGVGAVTGAITTKVARQYGTPFVAMTANKVARALEKNQDAIGKFSRPLIDAATKSPKEYVATINLMMKDPEFKRKLNEIEIGDGPIYRGPAKGAKK
jgi:hypothetical protein